METQARHVLVGVATVLFAGAILATIIWLAELDVGEDRDRYLVFFEGAVSGLEEGGAVRMNGVRIGSVERIRLQPERPDTVSVIVAVRPDAPIARGSVARLQPRGITGAQYVAIASAEPGAERLEDRAQGLPVLPAEPSALSRMVDRVPQILEDIGRATERIGALFGGEGEDGGAGDLIASLTEAGDAAPRAIEAVGVAAEEVARLARSGRITLDRVDDTLDRAERTLATADRALAAAEETLAGADGLVAQDLPPLIAEAREAAAAVADTAAAAERLVRRNDAPIARFANRGLAEIRQLVNEARLMVDSLTQVADMLERNPNAVIFGPGEGDFRPETRQ